MPHPSVGVLAAGRTSGEGARRGSVIVIVLIVAVVLVMVCGAALTVSIQGASTRDSVVEHRKAEFIADAGVTHALTNLMNDEEESRRKLNDQQWVLQVSLIKEIF